MPIIIKVNKEPLKQKIRGIIEQKREEKYKLAEEMKDKVCITSRMTEIDVILFSLQCLLRNLEQGKTVEWALEMAQKERKRIIDGWNNRKGMSPSLQIWIGFYEHDIEMLCYNFIQKR